MFRKLHRLKEWLLNKTPELKHLSMSDALLAKIVIDIKRESQIHAFKAVSLDSLAPIHPINRETALDKVDLRAKAIIDHKEKIARGGHISNAIMEEIMPSVSPIQAIPFHSKHLVFEGNGRLAALQRVFNGSDNITIEIDEFLIPSDSRIFEDIQKLQKMYTALN